MSAFSLDPKPTFKLSVEIPVPGEDFVPVEFECRYRTRKEAQAFSDMVLGDTANGGEPMADADVIKAVVVGWSLAEPCTPENLAKLAENYAGSAAAIYLAYLDELTKVRRKN